MYLLIGDLKVIYKANKYRITYRTNAIGTLPGIIAPSLVGLLNLNFRNRIKNLFLIFYLKQRFAHKECKYIKQQQANFCYLSFVLLVKILLIFAFILKGKQEEWRNVFIIIAFFYVIGFLAYLIWGDSGAHV